MRQPRLHLRVVQAERFDRETGETETEEAAEKPPVTPVVAEALRSLEGAAIQGQQTTETQCHAEDVHDQLVEEIVPAVMKVIGTVVGDPKQRRPDRENEETTEKKQVQERAERFAL